MYETLLATILETTGKKYLCIYKLLFLKQMGGWEANGVNLNGELWTLVKGSVLLKYVCLKFKHILSI